MLREMVKEIFGDVLPDWMTEDGFNSLLAMIGTNGQGIGTRYFYLNIFQFDLYLEATCNQRFAALFLLTLAFS